MYTLRREHRRLLIGQESLGNTPVKTFKTLKTLLTDGERAEIKYGETQTSTNRHYATALSQTGICCALVELARLCDETK